jgi:hypothetical protein
MNVSGSNKSTAANIVRIREKAFLCFSFILRWCITSRATAFAVQAVIHYKPKRTRNCKVSPMVVPYNEASRLHLIWPQCYVTPISTQVLLQGASVTAILLPFFIISITQNITSESK